MNSTIGHVGDGNFHQAMFYRPDIASEGEKVVNCVYTMVDRAVEMEETVTVSWPRRLHSFSDDIADRASQGEFN